MPEQNFKNHGRLIPLYHYVAYLAITFSLVITTKNFIKALIDESGRVQAAAMLSLTVAVLLALWFARSFALKAQDRAIRSEENLRHFIATGKPLDSRLKMRQIIGLRFASDDEFIALAKKAAEENLSQKQIKMEIKNWKADYNRV
ncbi:MAG TPA: DUF6526 family protein [Ferruginibacter sp.]|nr:DUF6526 family protein [Ferruginibacter sp.]